MISDQLRLINARLPQGTSLVCVSKFQPESAISEAYEAGQRVFGESHVQELQRKHEALPPDIEWHFIGHLQTNKVKYIAPYVSLIHAVDSPRLLAEISKQGQRCGRSIPCLMQLHVAEEETKHGFALAEARDYLMANEWRELTGARLVGFMCMATFPDAQPQIASEFAQAEELALWAEHNIDQQMTVRSWGMSGDWPIAVEHGATLVRIGTQIFGERHYD